jgi:plasmid stability protein
MHISSFTRYVYTVPVRNVTLSIEDRLLEESREYARRHGTTLNQLVRDLLRRTVAGEAGTAFEAMVAEAKARDLRSNGGPLTREEAHERA